MKFFVTGATGFIGSHFVNAAHEAGHTVVGLRRTPESRPRVALLQEPQWLDKPMEAVLASDLQGCELLVHFAAHTSNVPYDTLLNCLHWNLIVPLQLFEQACLAGIDRYLVAGSCFEYGQSADGYSLIPVDAPLDPTNSYAASKAAASIAFKQWVIQYHKSLTLLRIFHVFGEGEPASRLWPTLRRAAMEGKDFPMTLGQQVRDCLNVSDVAKAFLQAAQELEFASPGVLIRNLGSGHPQTIREFSEYWWRKWQASGHLLVGALPYRTGEVMRYVPDVVTIQRTHFPSLEGTMNPYEVLGS